MAHPQNSFRGLWAKGRIDIGREQLTYNSTTKGLTFTNGVDTHASALPGNTRIATNPTIVPINNSTGRCFAINTTGTTWIYLGGTTVQPTT